MIKIYLFSHCPQGHPMIQPDVNLQGKLKYLEFKMFIEQETLNTNKKKSLVKTMIYKQEKQNCSHKT